MLFGPNAALRHDHHTAHCPSQRVAGAMLPAPCPAVSNRGFEAIPCLFRLRVAKVNAPVDARIPRRLPSSPLATAPTDHHSTGKEQE